MSRRMGPSKVPGWYDSYEDAYAHGVEDVWPGCGRVGRCMPCGSIHYTAPYYACIHNQRHSCPSPKPEPEHEILGGHCKRCAMYAVNILSGLSQSPINLLAFLAGAGGRASIFVDVVWRVRNSAVRALIARGHATIDKDLVVLTAEGTLAAKYACWIKRTGSKRGAWPPNLVEVFGAIGKEELCILCAPARPDWYDDTIATRSVFTYPYYKLKRE